jgi:predicted exporter
MTALPDSFEPSLAILETADPKAATALEAHLRSLVQRGLLAGFSSPAALLLAPQNDAIDTAPAVAAFRDALAANGLEPAAFRNTFDALAALGRPGGATRWSEILPAASPWWFVVDRMLAPDGHTIAAFLEPAPGFRDAASAPRLEQAVRESGLPVLVTGWTQTLGALVPWAKQELLVFGGGVAGVILLVLALVYRDARDWLAHALGLALAVGATIATLKLLGARINLLNVLAFPLMLAVGVDYGMHLVLAVRDGHVATVIKPVAISGLTTVAGFASLTLARNPSLNGLGLVCALGVGWSLVAALTIVLPLAARLRRSVPGGRVAA